MMREQLIQYVNLLFAGAQEADEIRAEILQNTLDRYDDLIAQGKSPEAAYRLAISGIGDINEVLGTIPSTEPSVVSGSNFVPAEEDDPKRKKLRATAIALYILCAVPLFILSDLGVEALGISLTIMLVAAATYLMMITKGSKTKDADDDEEEARDSSPKSELKKSINDVIWAVGLGVYLLVSFITGAWYITWIIFPLIGSIQGLIKAIMDLKEENKHEN